MDLIVWNCLPFAHQLLSGMLNNDAIKIDGLEHYVPSVFTISVVMPLPPTEYETPSSIRIFNFLFCRQAPITFNNRLSLNNLLERVESTAAQQTTQPCPGLPLSIQRPISKVGRRVVLSISIFMLR